MVLNGYFLGDTPQAFGLDNPDDETPEQGDPGIPPNSEFF